MSSVSKNIIDMGASSTCKLTPVDCNTCNLVVVMTPSNDAEEFSEGDGDSLAQSDIVPGLKIKVKGNPRNMAELGVSPREPGRPLFNFAAFERQELKAMLQRDLMIFTDRLKAKEDVSSPIHSVPQQKKKKRG
ncbi:hypothetical protein LguiA_009518 [Lonicera macranthoides]